MYFIKANNQYFGEYMEIALCDLINNTSSDFGEHTEEIYCDAENALAFLQNNIGIINSAENCGRNYTKSSCDIKLNNSTELEIKYVSAGTGTYYNTSINKIAKAFNFIEYSAFLEEQGYYKFLEEKTGYNIKYGKKSPVSITDSSYIRKNMPEVYEEIQQEESKHRIEYIQNFYKYLIDNNLIMDFFSSLISKELSNKHNPDYILVYNHKTKESHLLTYQDFSFLGKEAEQSGKYGLRCGNIRAQFGWQNGNGLNNPTIRVFVEKGK